MAEPAAAGAEPAGVKSARRTVELLETFAEQDAWLSLSDLHARTGFPRSSLHGLLRTLYEAGWLEADPGTARYRLGVRALICGTAYLDRDPAIPFATQALESIRERTGFTAHYARRNGTEVVYLETRESRHSTHLVSRVGRTLPAHATALGKALLSELTQDEIAALFPGELPGLTPRTITSLDALFAECEATRRRGFAWEVEEGTPGVRCVAAVVPYRIPGTDAMSCSLPVGQVSDEEARQVGELLAEAAAELGQQLRRAGIR
ncbi:DNA-binding IclR family transcriptional regulator [Amycolatopsis bartoniae]|uniref:Glycerol operon regulatory protein n=1 Tax=Amycolatopsis bartoniae TaxID=941986 RepID=A0A8H9IWA1_9PSEU|nr:IclR family transcriptional regulator [Amycolatopsis bartoniae]MBB2936416.1 DNA-binding IclR family transcriptional regulator [Amycolatopsis bartoniae]TVT11095.1 IclR family transcriptional regulator [Amycolatopsis bartoniae]GHF69089.1 IclR family transcriptional regulator [Amycolatopsis bartoniae]